MHPPHTDRQTSHRRPHLCDADDADERNCARARRAQPGASRNPCRAINTHNEASATGRVASLLMPGRCVWQTRKGFGLRPATCPPSCQPTVGVTNKWLLSCARVVPAACRMPSRARPQGMAGALAICPCTQGRSPDAEPIGGRPCASRCQRRAADALLAVRDPTRTARWPSEVSAYSRCAML